jgi:hypothetical protein
VLKPQEGAVYGGAAALVRDGERGAPVCGTKCSAYAEPGAAAGGGALRFFGVQRLTSRRAGERCLSAGEEVTSGIVND